MIWIVLAVIGGVAIVASFIAICACIAAGRSDRWPGSRP